MSLTEILEMILETLGMTFISCAFAYLFGLPTGVLLNVTSKKGIMPCKWLNTIFSLIINILRSIPCLIVVVLLMMPKKRALIQLFLWHSTRKKILKHLLLPDVLPRDIRMRFWKNCRKLMQLLEQQLLIRFVMLLIVCWRRKHRMNSNILIDCADLILRELLQPVAIIHI